MAGDAPIFEVAGRGDELLAEVLELGCQITGHGTSQRGPNAGQGPIVGYRADKERFVLYWYEEKDTTILPARMTATQICPMISAWLDGTADYGTQPDHDGDNGKGWLVFTGSWGKVCSRGSSYPAPAATKAVEAEVLRKLEGHTEPIEALAKDLGLGSGRMNLISSLAHRITSVAWAAQREQEITYDYGHRSFLAIEPWWEMYGK